MFGIIALIADKTKSRDELVKEEKEWMIKLAREYDFGSARNSTNRRDANAIWDKWHDTECCGNDGPNDWKNWGHPGPPRACCASEQNVDSDNVCTRPYPVGCMERYLNVAIVTPVSGKYAYIFSLILSLMALFLAFKYYYDGQTDATGQMGVDRAPLPLDGQQDGLTGSVKGVQELVKDVQVQPQTDQISDIAQTHDHLQKQPQGQVEPQ